MDSGGRGGGREQKKIWSEVWRGALSSSFQVQGFEGFLEDFERSRVLTQDLRHGTERRDNGESTGYDVWVRGWVSKEKRMEKRFG